MQLKAKLLGLGAGRPVVILHKKTAEALDRHVDERVYVGYAGKNSKRIIAVVDIASHLVKQDEIIASNEVAGYLGLKKGDAVDISIAPRPDSIFLIHRKLDCERFDKQKLKRIIEDIVNNALTEAEIAYFVSAVYNCGMSLQETAWMTESIVETGQKLNLRKKIIADKHCIGGVAGNRTTPIVVAICAAAGLTIPKTSSRAITSAAGTADVIETIARVDFSISELKKIIRKTNACLIWGGSLRLAPADDKIIQVERLLKLDPEPQLLASIMAKKLAVGATHVLIDIPFGKTAKVTKQEAGKLRKKFLWLAKYFKIKLDCILTDGSQPIGNGIGPVLEMRDVLAVLKQLPLKPIDLEKKSLLLSSRLLELAGMAKKGKGMKLAQDILQSGKAFEKFRQIILAQKGNFNNLHLAPFSFSIKAKKRCRITEIDNKKISALARRVGCPADKEAGLYLYRHAGNAVEKGEKFLAIYAKSKDKLKEAVAFYKKAKPVSLR
ncbi:AMP phosphorylase [Candidatus Pacearchaeota archaeon]|nr:AMP phosphorylase [Candidatus Pacearchaeota archaeon]